ncbi:DUF296 domain-containing protein [bacterium]|nr:DUF296 domain-containing protein [bacterium]MBU1752680.1 DUF296 domain-containing protein [bacterium]
MQYQEGKIGRVFAIRFDHNEDLILNLKELIINEAVQAGMVFFLGALEEGKLVVGPEKACVPPIPVWTSFTDGREVLGIGTIFWDTEAPNIHIHFSAGRGKEILLGCLRKEAKVYLVIEAFLIEVTDLRVQKQYFDEIGISMLRFEGEEEEKGN